jgi:hypothetical protein
MRYLLIVGGLIGLLLGISWMLDYRWGEGYLIRGAAITVAAAVSLAIGLATCDIVEAIRRAQERRGSLPQDARVEAAPNRQRAASSRVGKQSARTDVRSVASSPERCREGNGGAGWRQRSIRHIGRDGQ